MPEVYVHAIEGRTREQKRALIKDGNATSSWHGPERVRV